MEATPRATVVGIVAPQAGGFNDLLDGVTLTGKGLTVRLVRGADQPTGDETTRHAATLTVQRADGAERTYDGTWTRGS